MSIRVAIFDDNKNIRNSIILLLNTVSEIEVTGTFSDAVNCVEKIIVSRPDIILMDIEMPGMDGIAAVKLLTKEFPQVLVLIQTVFEDNDRIFESICAGASGYILKSQINSHLINAIKELQVGGSPMSPSIARRVLGMLQHGYKSKGVPDTDYKLTRREKEVLAGIVNGLTYKMIGYELDISYETVRTHIKRIYEKLHVVSQAEAVAKAINQKLI